MEKMKLMIETTNAAFEDNKNYELARILRELADKLENGNEPTGLKDINGNLVGVVQYFE